MAAPADDILREFLDSSSDFFFRLRLTPDRAFEFASAAAPLFTGYSPGELRARPELAASFLHPASLPDFEEALRSPAPSTLDVRFLHADGHAVPASLHVVPANGSGGGACVSGLARLTGAAGSFFPVVEALTEAACVMAGERIVYANPACARLTGRSVEELLTFPSLYGLLDPGERAAAAERHGKRLPGEAVEGPCRFRLQRTDGSAFWAQFESFPTSWNGRPATLVLARDVTQVKEWEDRWRIQSLVLDQMQDRVAVAGLDGRLTYVNDALCRSLARPREELLGQPVEILGDDPARGPSQRAILQHVLEHGEWYGDLTNRAADGTERPVECRVTLVRDENGQPAAIFGVATDLTAQRRAEAEIRGRDARYRAAIESSLDGFVMTGLDGRILEVNDAFARLSGFSRGELLEMNVSALDLDRGPNEIQAASAEIARTGRTHFETRLRRKDGSACPAEISAARWPIGGGRVFCFVRDLAQRARSDALLRARLLLLQPGAQVSLDSLMRAALDEAEQLTASSIGFFHFVDDDQENLQLQTWSTNTIQNMCCAEGKGRHYPVSEAGVWADALRLGEPVVHNDYASLANRKGLPPGHAEVIREISVPVIRQGKVAAILGVGNKASDYTPADVEALQSLAGIAMDLVAHRRDRLALEASQARLGENAQLLSSILDHTHMMAVFLDARFNFIWVNRAYAETCRHEPSYFPGRNHFDLYPHAENQAIFQGVVDTGKPYFASAKAFEFPDQPERGITYWDWSLVPIRDQEGRVSGLVFTLAEVTARIRAELALQAKTEELDNYFNNALDLFCIADIHGHFLHVNPEWAAVLGYSCEELAGCRFLDLVHPGDHPATIEMMAALAAQNTVRGFVNRYRAKDGVYHWIEWRARPAGELVYAAARDITGRKETEAQLLQAQKMESVGRLAGGIAHDFNNLLTVINGYSDLLLGRIPPGDPSRQGLAEIAKAGARAAALTRQMLAFGRKQMLQPRLIDLNEAISESRGLLQRLMGEDIILETVLAPGLGSVRVDPGQLSQVLLNLAANARDAMPCGGRLLVATSATELNRPPAADEEGFTPGPYVLLEVRDTGAGMDDATQARLFEPFFTTKEEGRGSGLGLSSVYGIVRQSGGWIAVESAPGAGTAFLIYFPACEGSVLVPESPHPASPSPRSHETILLVEDEPEVRAFASAVLRSEGYRVLEAGDGFSALALAEEHAGPIHLLLTDVVMPRMPGSTLAANLRQLRPDARVLFMSGYPGDVVAVRGALSGPVSFLSKPFTPEQLTGALRAALAG